MAIALKVGTNGRLAQFTAGDDLLINVISGRTTSSPITIGANLDSGQEVRIGSTIVDTRILGDLFVDGSSTISVDETVTGSFNANGNVNLGNNTGDTINLGGGTADILNAQTALLMGGNAIRAQDYFEVTPTALAAQANNYDPTNFGIADILRITLTGSQSITGFAAPGVGDNERFVIVNTDASDILTLTNQDASSTAANRIAGPNGTDIMLYPGEAAMLTYDSTSTRWRAVAIVRDISAGNTLQSAYIGGNTIDVTSAFGFIDFANDTAADTTTVLNISRNPASGTAGIGLNVDLGLNTTGDAVVINQQGSGDALDVQDGGGSVLRVTGAGAINLTPTSGQNLVATVAGAGVIDIDAAAAITIDSSGAGISIDAAAASNFSTSAGNLTLDAAAGELVFDDVGNSGLTLSQAGDRTLDQTGAGEVLSGKTSVIGALNALARSIDVTPSPTLELPIANGVTITAQDVVAISTVSGRATQANLNNDTAFQVIGIALNTGTGNVGGTVIVRIALEGHTVTAGSGFTVGNAVYAPDGTGAPTPTAPSGTGDVVMRLGWALTTTSFVISFGPQVIL